MSLDDRLRDDAESISAELTRLRHELHQRPEIGLDLPRTQGIVLRELEDLPLEVSVGGAVSSVTGVLRGSHPGPAVLLRADMDALPIGEQTGLPYVSRVEGVMHACGHDLHTAMLVGAARLLAAHRDAIAGDVVFMFQPGEEGFDGAGKMLAEGVLDAAGPRVSSAYGMHVMSSQIPRGTFTVRPGTFMSASDAMYVTVRGAGGHGSAPHRALDPITAAAEIITALQTLVTRRFDVFDPVVITVGALHAGTRRNVIPDDARLEITVRSFSDAARERVRLEAPALCERVASAFGLTAEVEWVDEYPATINDPDHAQFVASVVTEVFGEHRYAPMRDPHPGAEDFSRVLQAVPGSYLMLGAHPGEDADTPDNHSPRAVFDDSVLAEGALLHTQLAVRALRRDATNSPTAPALEREPA